MSGGLPEDWDDRTQALIENLQSSPAKITPPAGVSKYLNAIGLFCPNAARRLGGSGAQ